MSRRSNFDTPAAIARRINEGRGTGRGLAYRPWFEIKDVASLGRRHRRRNTVDGRVTHLLSDLEQDCLFLGEYLCQRFKKDRAYSLCEIREQFPLLPLAETIDIARHLGIRHPAFRGQVVVMTTDQVWTLEIQGVTLLVPISVKYHADHDGCRSQQKAAIEREFWRRRDADLLLFNEHSVGRTFRSNWSLLRYCLRPGFIDDFPDGMLEAVDQCLRKKATSGRYCLTELAEIAAGKLKHPKGQVIPVMHYLISTCAWDLDLFTTQITSLNPIKIAR